MPPNALVVVGDRFEAFLANRGTISASALLSRLRDHSEPRTLSVVIGQGLAAEQLSEVAQLIDSNPHAVAVGGVPAFVEQGLTHKHDPKNVMIGTPERVATDRFVADLLIDERTEVLADHLTGQHIPAITLMEAARQTWTAVTEMFFLADTPQQRFVITSMRSAFHKYVFPLPATVEYRLVGRQESAVGQVFECCIGVYQADVLAAQIEAEYRLIPEAFSEKHESMAARQAVVSQLNRMEQAAEKIG
ncbi:MAG: AfsA-related hotdog domain-containing protein [Pseudonocardiaceae bacterium]